MTLETSFKTSQMPSEENTSNSTSGDPLWIIDPSILYSPNKLMDFIPLDSQTLSEKINALIRMSIYTSLLLYLYYGNASYLYIIIFAMIVSYVYIVLETKKNTIKTTERFEPVIDTVSKTPEYFSELNQEYASASITPTSASSCTHPTIDNPFMNFTMADRTNISSDGKIINRAPACDTNDASIKSEIRTSFNEGLYLDVNDLFERHNSQREFYTMPSTTLYSDPEGKFKNWLYNTPSTCKEDTTKCQVYEDIRAESRQPLLRD